MAGNVSSCTPAFILVSNEVYFVCNISDTTSRIVIIKRDIVKRVNTERALLRRFQGNALLRPMIDEIEEPKADECAAIVLKHYDCHIGEIAKEKGLSPREARSVGSCVLQALRVIYTTGYIYTGLFVSTYLVP